MDIHCSGCRNQVPGWQIQSTEMYFSHNSGDWKLETKVVDRFGSFQGLSPWLAEDHLLPVYLTGFSLCVCLCPNLFFLQGH